ncbi:hypothetical protein NC651_014761 [Populus alba x Populus x berolinensis]|nr:hypothetical protein NC651_014761 [Populus alba x Populus x berolinensis]
MAMTCSKMAFVAFLLLAAHCFSLSTTVAVAEEIPAAALSCERADDCKKYPIVCPAMATATSNARLPYMAS